MCQDVEYDHADIIDSLWRTAEAAKAAAECANSESCKDDFEGKDIYNPNTVKEESEFKNHNII